MRQNLLLVACVCSCLAVISAGPVPAGGDRELDVLQIPLPNGKELDVLTIGTKDQEQAIAERNKRTIGLLRELFPEITQLFQSLMARLMEELIKSLEDDTLASSGTLSTAAPPATEDKKTNVETGNAVGSADNKSLDKRSNATKNLTEKPLGSTQSKQGTRSAQDSIKQNEPAYKVSPQTPEANDLVYKVSDDEPESGNSQESPQKNEPVYKVSDEDPESQTSPDSNDKNEPAYKVSVKESKSADSSPESPEKNEPVYKVSDDSTDMNEPAYKTHVVSYNPTPYKSQTSTKPLTSLSTKKPLDTTTRPSKPLTISQRSGSQSSSPTPSITRPSEPSSTEQNLIQALTLLTQQLGGLVPYLRNQATYVNSPTTSRTAQPVTYLPSQRPTLRQFLDISNYSDDDVINIAAPAILKVMTKKLNSLSPHTQYIFTEEDNYFTNTKVRTN